MNGNSEGLPLGGPSVDLTKVPALNHRRSVTFMNNFLVNTSNFLNNFSAVAEEHLSKQSLEMQKLEISLNILEAKLASIPGLDDVVAQKEPSVTATQNTPNAPDSKIQEDVPENPLAAAEVGEAAPVVMEKVITVKEDPRYAKYYKMVNFGVPKVAIENKMRMDGLDPSLLDHPDAPVPDAVPMSDSDDESDNESKSLSSGDDFSD